MVRSNQNVPVGRQIEAINATQRDLVVSYVKDVLPEDLFLGFDMHDPYVPGGRVAGLCGFTEPVWSFISSSTLDWYLKEYAGVRDPELVEDFCVISDGKRWVVALRREDPTRLYVEAPQSLEALAQWYKAIKDFEGEMR